MIIFSIDTSCDDTSVAITQGTHILANEISSQISIHQSWGGVVPILAARAHKDNIDAVIGNALLKAGLTVDRVDAFAVTYGPGLAIALEVGIQKAKELATMYHKPLIAVNHIEGHLLSFLSEHTDFASFFPALGVILSGGHSLFIDVQEVGTYKILGQTLDDAMGEAFDKVGRMLDIPYPAGAQVERYAVKGIHGRFILPVPMLGIKSADMSFSGLKTATNRLIASLKTSQDGQITTQDICDICLAFQTAVLTHLTKKLTYICQKSSYTSLLLGGGVAANEQIRHALEEIAQTYQMKFYYPAHANLCMDNAAMIGIAAHFKLMRHETVQNVDDLTRDPIALLN